MSPDNYIDLYKDNGTIIQWGSSGCLLYDFKKAAAAVLKPPEQCHFKFYDILHFRGFPFALCHHGFFTISN